MGNPFRNSDTPWNRDLFEFNHGKASMTRFPPNVERIAVERGASGVTLVTSRNDTELRFPLSRSDAAHLATLLNGEGEA